MANTDKQLAELLAEERKLLERQKSEQDALKKKLRAVKKQLREEQRKLNERRAELLGHCMMQKFSSDPEAKNAILLKLYGFLSKREDRELFGLPPQIESWERSLLELFRSLSLFQERLPYALAGEDVSPYARQPRGSGMTPERQTVFGLWV